MYHQLIILNDGGGMLVYSGGMPRKYGQGKFYFDYLGVDEISLWGATLVLECGGAHVVLNQKTYFLHTEI